LDAVAIAHSRWVAPRRISVLASWFAQLIPEGMSILDVGCGDGLLASALLSQRPDLNAQGVDVLRRDRTFIPVQIFDGFRLPFADNAFDGVLFSDVLHHTCEATALLREARRVSTGFVFIKDHFRKGLVARQRLMLMDWVGNARFGVALPYLYWTEDQWSLAWQKVGLQVDQVVKNLNLYPPGIDWLFGGNLHFVARLVKTNN
jgi:SAM-dependent methyltransferase